MKINTNSNSYTIIYAAVVVVIFAFALAFVSASLSDKQQENDDMDKMKQILTSLNIDTSKVEDVKAAFSKYIKADQIINSNAEVLAETGGFEINMKEQLAKKLEDRKLPLYICDVDGSTKYILPLYGAGLWDALWGYIALNDDKNTVYGVYFDHGGETPGLGAEIAHKEFQDEFLNLIVSKEGKVVISVVKKGKVVNPEYEVDGISGGTITSQGVDAMLKRCISQYDKFLTSK